MNLIINDSITIPSSELEESFVRASGAGGQNVNKVATAVELRFAISNSSLPPYLKEKLLALATHQVTDEGVIIIKCSETRFQERNRQLAKAKLREIILQALKVQKTRIKSRPTRASQERRMNSKKISSAHKKNRSKLVW